MGTYQWRQDLVVLPPFSPERETCCMLSFCRAFEFLPLYKRTSRFTPAILEDCTVPRIRSGFLPTCEALQGFTPTRKWRRHFCRQRTKFAAFTLSLQNGKRVVYFPFAELLRSISLSSSSYMIRIWYVFSSRHSFTQFSNLSFIHLLSSQYILHKGMSGAFASLFPVYIAVHRKIESLLFFYYGGIMKHNHFAMMSVKYAIMDAK